MSPRIAQLLAGIKLLEQDLETELARQNAKLRIGLEQGRVIFEEEILRRHCELRISLARYVLRARPLVVLTAVFIYVLIVPLVLLDLFFSLYQAVCFPAYGITKVRRGAYFLFDRRYLAYLNALEKLNCAYCTYANGVLAYTREIASRTEAYWCPIKHARRVIGAHGRYSVFEDYGDADAYRARLEEHRRALGEPDQSTQ